MSRFEEINGLNVNIDKIRCFWREGECGETLVVELDNGKRIRRHDERKAIQMSIEGESHVVQVIPCIKPLYARYTEEGKEMEYPIYYLGLCADGYARPLDVYGDVGMIFADEACNYIGLYSEALEEERKEDS